MSKDHVQVTKKLTKKLYRFVNETLKSDSVELCEFISSNIESIKQSLDITEDDYELVSNRFTDSMDEEYEFFATVFAKLCEGPNNRLKVSVIEGSYFVGLNDYARNTDQKLIDRYFEVLQLLCDSEYKESPFYKDFPLYYEEFCKKWFEYFCREVKTTPVTNDKGIDLLGVISDSKIISSIAKDLEVSFIAQIKLYASPVDTSVVRKILGDALLLTFDNSLESVCNEVNVFSPTIIFVIAHSGFTKDAHAFARSKRIILLDSKDMLRIIAYKNDLKKYDCIRYLDSLERKIKSWTRV